jgi:hypothetical protein
MLITILGMIKPTAVQSQIRPFRLISGWKYARRSGSILIGQGSGVPRATCHVPRVFSNPGVGL